MQLSFTVDISAVLSLGSLCFLSTCAALGACPTGEAAFEKYNNTNALGAVRNFNINTLSACLADCLRLADQCAGVDYNRVSNECWIHQEANNVAVGNRRTSTQVDLYIVIPCGMDTHCVSSFCSAAPSVRSPSRKLLRIFHMRRTIHCVEFPRRDLKAINAITAARHGSFLLSLQNFLCKASDVEAVLSLPTGDTLRCILTLWESNKSEGFLCMNVLIIPNRGQSTEQQQLRPPH